MKNKLDFTPYPIIVAMPARFFQEYTMDKFLQDIENMNTVDNFVWYRVIKNLPKIQTLYCYWVIDGKVRYRMESLKWCAIKRCVLPGLMAA